MCKALETRDTRMKVSGAIELLRFGGSSDEDIIVKVTDLFKVTRDYVIALLAPQKA